LASKNFQRDRNTGKKDLNAHFPEEYINRCTKLLALREMPTKKAIYIFPCITLENI
jgi:hypothetical protein